MQGNLQLISFLQQNNSLKGVKSKRMRHPFYIITQQIMFITKVIPNVTHVVNTYPDSVFFHPKWE